MSIDDDDESLPEDGANEPEMLLVRMPVGTARAFAKRTREIVGAGRPDVPALRLSHGRRRTHLHPSRGLMPAPDLVTAELTLTGRITTASNATFLGSIGDVVVVYKPIAGESPLWDFPQGTLAHREVAAYLVSQALGWDVVPHTWLRDGPLGEGMVQLWQEQDPAQNAVDLIAADHVPETGWKQVLAGTR